MEQILILDFGSQLTQLIARRIREAGVYCEIWPHNVEPSKILEWQPNGIVLSGGPYSVHDAGAPMAPSLVYELGVPVLGICYGLQMMCHQLGGKVATDDQREFGRADITITGSCALFDGVAAQTAEPSDAAAQPRERGVVLSEGMTISVWMSHSDHVIRLPEGFQSVAVSGSPAAIADDERRFYGLQFHPEVTHTNYGAELIRNFVRNVAKLSGDWSMENFRIQQVAQIRAMVGDAKVICGLSGGVDSSVVALLIHEAIGDQLTCIFVDHGLLREGEAEQVVRTFRDRFKIKLLHLENESLFLHWLRDLSDPEAKRKMIGQLFIDVFEEEASQIGAEYLAQGTLYPDVIESIGGLSATIKSHHNVGGMPERMRMKLIEPLRDLFKDEVRTLGRQLGLPESIVSRHPFPGPGLAIRIPGEVTREKIELLRKADAIFLSEIRNARLYDEIWQAFAVLLPVHTVGVMGDGRTYEYACALRAVTSTDGMTADFYPFSTEFLGWVSNRIINEVPGINRVVYDYTSKPPGTIEWE